LFLFLNNPADVIQERGVPTQEEKCSTPHYKNHTIRTFLFESKLKCSGEASSSIMNLQKAYIATLLGFLPQPRNQDTPGSRADV